MSNALATLIQNANLVTVDNNAPTFALQVGTKKAPKAFQADLAGVALTNGKAGREARAQTKSDMPQQAMKGGFGTFSGYLIANFPKVHKDWQAKVDGRIDALQTDMDDNDISEANAKLLAQLQANPMRTRWGFDKLTELIVDAYANGAKATKAQNEALQLVYQYRQLRADAIAAARAELIAERNQPTA